jgi:hypothetical protein
MNTVEAGGREKFIELLIVLLVNFIQKETLNSPQNSPTSINSSSTPLTAFSTPSTLHHDEDNVKSQPVTFR